MKPIAPQAAATIQKRSMILVSDQASNSKWWWIGAILNTRLCQNRNENTWISTDSASITKMPPITISRISVLVITASAGDRAADRQRAGVAHEHARREAVEPEEADAGAAQAAGDKLEVVVVRR